MNEWDMAILGWLAIGGLIASLCCCAGFILGAIFNGLT